MSLVDGVHHITFLTEDMDRLLAFYVRVFDAEVTLDMTEEGLRHAFLRVGPTTVLHPFQTHADRPLFFIQGVWVLGEEEFVASGNAYEPSVTRGFKAEIDDATAVVHGDDFYAAAQHGQG